MKKYIGIELNKEHFVVAFPREYSQKFDIKRYNHSEQDMALFVKSLSNNFTCVVENKGIYSTILANEVYKSGFEIAIVYPGQIMRFAQTKFLKEKIDPVIISHYGEEMRPQLYHPTNEFIEKVAKKWENLKYLQYIKLGKRKKLHALETSYNPDKEEIESLKNSLVTSEAEIHKMEDELESFVNRFINPLSL